MVVRRITSFSFPSRQLRRFLRRTRSRNEHLLILGLASVVGVLSGLAAVLLKYVVHEIQYLLKEKLYGAGHDYLYYLAPLVGVVGTACLARYVLREKLGHGITQLLYAIAKNHSIIRLKRSYTLLSTSALTVGMGGSVGLEAPIVGTGAALASTLARWINLGQRNRELLIGCGAAGAIAGIFNSPVAGSLFAIEVILTDLTIFHFMPVLIAAILGAVIAQLLVGSEALFSFTLTDPFLHQDILLYILLGVIGGFAALHFLRMNFYVERLIARLTPRYLHRVILGGLLLTLLIFLLPPLYGEGYETITGLLNGKTDPLFERILLFDQQSFGSWSPLALLFLLLIAKPIATAATFSGGGSGGIFAPSLLMGAMGGYLFATGLGLIFPALELSTSNFALAGMSAMLSALLHAPLTAIFLIAEITESYALFIPLMITSTASYLSISYFERYSFYSKHLIERGDLIPSQNRDQRILSQIKLAPLVEKNLLCVGTNDSLETLVEKVQKSQRNIFPVLDNQGILHGIVTLNDIREIMFEAHKRAHIRVEHLMSPAPEAVSIDASLREVMECFERSQLWNIPVVKDKKYIGIVSMTRIFNAYRKHLVDTSK